MELVTRREALVRVGTGLGLRPAANDQKLPDPQSRKLTIIVAGGHPGDAEYGCCGTIARYSEAGHEVVLLHLNNGQWPIEKGGAPARVRLAEASKAAEILKARPAFARQINGQAIVNGAHFDEFRKIIENLRPDAVFTHWPIDQHRDIVQPQT